MKKLLLLLATASLLTFATTVPAFADGGGGDDDDDDDDDGRKKSKVTLCHATGSASNPFVKITVAASGALKGHAGSKHQDGRDIIPPFSSSKGSFAGQNWDANGQAVFNNGCKVPAVAPPPPPATTPTPPPVTTTVISPAPPPVVVIGQPVVVERIVFRDRVIIITRTRIVTKTATRTVVRFRTTTKVVKRKIDRKKPRVLPFTP